MDYLISMYIDNEMDLDEKKQFVENVHHDHALYIQALDLLEQEIVLRTPARMPDPQPDINWRLQAWIWLGRMFKPLGFASAGFCTALLVFFYAAAPTVTPSNPNRFVLFEPHAKQVALAGSFTQWQRISMTRVGSSGYWELHLQVPDGEHRYAYILDGDRRIADPTLPTREKDDFGGVNSVFHVGEHI